MKITNNGIVVPSCLVYQSKWVLWNLNKIIFYLKKKQHIFFTEIVEGTENVQNGK